MSKLIFKPINKFILSDIAFFYRTLTNPLADLNAVMMVAWQSVLDLRYHINKDGILFVIGFFENKFWGWGPPIGPNVKESHVNVLLDALDEVNNRSSSILYLWDYYQIMSDLRKSSLYSISHQAAEYIYLTRNIASLPIATMKFFHKKKERFFRKYKPVIRRYSSSLSEDCMLILKNWLRQKEPKVPKEYLEKFRIEAEVCKYALQEQLPLFGIVVYIDNSPEAFCLGSEHSKSWFNCIFEKANLSIDGLSVFVFSELGEMLKNEFKYINAGEDWGILYLKEIKLKWQPTQIQKSYKLSRK